MPVPTLLNPCEGGIIAVLRVAGILSQQFAWNIGTFPTVGKAVFLAAHRNGTFSMKRISVGFNAAFTSGGFFPLAVCTVQSTAGVDFIGHNSLSVFI